MFQKYGSDPIRNLLVDKVESTAREHNDAVYNLKAYDSNKTDYEEETNELVDIVRQSKGI